MIISLLKLSKIYIIKIYIMFYIYKLLKKVFNINPAPQPSPIVGPNPDVAKCICGGTGIIVQGDGHKTPCPYHAKTTNLKR
jgi:hypothetical protein